MKIKGTIKKVLFRSEDTGYAALRLDDDSVVNGTLPHLSEGEKVEFEGEWVNHPKYGEQFKSTNFKVILPTTVNEIKSYLAAGYIKGIREGLAAKIVEKFGEETFEILENSIDRLLEIEGISEKKFANIKRSWEEQKASREVMVFLQSHGVTPGYAVRIYQKYGTRALTTITNDPYRLMYDIWGIGFKIADKIASNLGFTKDHPARIRAGLIYTINGAAEQGHVYLPFDECKTELKELVDYELQPNDALFSMPDVALRVFLLKDRVYSAQLFKFERNIEERLTAMLDAPPVNHGVVVVDAISENLSEEQRGAVELSLKSRVMILTGGPGTGKTTTLKSIISMFRLMEKQVVLCAPTGRAAKRMTEVIEVEAKTIHRLLEYNPVSNEFMRNEEVPLEADLIVVDEFSMVDTFLFSYLLDAIDVKTTLLLVGDKDQLPSVGPGNVLNDLLASELLPAVVLTKIFRQAEASNIVTTAHSINKGEMPKISNSKDSDLFFIERATPEEVHSLVIELITTRLPGSYGYNKLEDIQLLTPMNRGNLGIQNFNSILQENINSNPPAYKSPVKVFKEGDKVMQLRNNYDKEVFNGDIGFIKDVYNDTEEVEIDFSGRVITYQFNELDEIQLAYAVTVHKSQGSEYPCVILILANQHYVMLQRNLLYTAITRARKTMIIVGSKRALEIAVSNKKTSRRYTSLFEELPIID